METECVYCAVRTKSLNITYVTFKVERDKENSIILIVFLML
jgi:hypothetical protein